MQTQDTITIRKGGGVISLFGMPFLIFGLFAISSPVTGLMGDKHGSPPPWFFIVPFGSIFTLVGAALVFGRAGTILDRRARTVTSWWGLLVPFKKAVRSLNDFQAVTITHEIRRSKNSTYSVYPVRLEGDTNKLNIEEPHDYQQARGRAEEIAKFIGFGIVDRSTGEAVVRDADALDESLRARARRTGEQPAMPAPPTGCRIIMHQAGQETVFEIPARANSAMILVPMTVIAVVFAIAFFGFFLPFFLNLKRGGPAWALLAVFVFGLFTLPIVMIWRTLFRRLISAERVVITAHALQLDGSVFGKSDNNEIQLDRLEELEIKQAAQSAVVARSDQQTLEFGAGLSQEELQWLRDAIHFHIVAKPQ